MKVRYSKGPANHTGPESCVRRRREAHHEALTGVRAGQPLSLENRYSLGAHAVTKAEGETGGRAYASAQPTWRGPRPWHARKLLARGFRPGRSAHQALQAAWTGIMGRGGRWVLDVDVRKYFASISHAKLRELLARRVTDGVVRRLIDKWLKAGVLEEGQLSYPDAGTPEGGVISPLMANVYLHYVLEEWFCEQVQPRLRGHSTLVRYCDDFVMVFAYKDDAERVLEVLGKRLGKYGLQLHPDKTRMVDFRFRDSVPHDGGTPTMATTFDFLGFTHVWVRSRKGNPVVRRQTAKARLARAISAIDQQCRAMRHWLLREQHQRLCRMLKGHYAYYYGITGNFERLASLYEQARRNWRKWLSQRSNNSPLGWAAFERVLKHLPLPRPRIVRRYA